ncbi:hypothetical protein GCM10020331_102650 [Ectobacillus funiculus]
MRFHEEIYLAPLVESSVALFLQQASFSERPEFLFPSEDPNKPLTWDEVLEIAKRINNPDKGVYGIDPAQGFGEGETAAYF